MSKLQALLQALKARAPTTHEVVGVDRTCEHSGDGQVDCEYWRALSAIGSHGATARATRRAPATALRLGARRLGDAPGTAPTTAGDSGKRSAVGNVLMGAIGTGRTLPGGSAARRAESSFRGSVEAGGVPVSCSVNTLWELDCDPDV